MKNLSYEEFKYIIENTQIVFDTTPPPLIDNFSILNYSVIGEVPYSKNQTIENNGTVTISPRILLTIEKDDNLFEIFKNINEIEARVLFFNNLKFEFNDEPRIRYKLNLSRTLVEVKDKYKDKNLILLITPKSIYWQISLLYILSQKLFSKNNKRF
ncbi:MAG TPA: hypothetical protein PLD27_03465 [bacterium]|nr:hypothetical protein [bacterium]HOL47451.1 hypothetical protein [bacterium]HPQ18758.1 hypothetical protein [bacterium]